MSWRRRSGALSPRGLRLVMLGFAALGVLGLAQGTPCVPPPPGLVAWWPLDEGVGATSVSDLVGGHAGTPVPAGVGPAGPTPLAAMVGGGLHFPGPSTFVQVFDHPSLNFGTGDFTLEAWVNPTEAASGAVQPIVDKTEPVAGGTGFKGYRLYFQYGRLYFLLSDGAALAGVFGVQVHGGPYGKWLLVVAFRQGPMVGVHVFEAGVGYTTNWIVVPVNPLNVDNTGDLLIGGIQSFGWGIWGWPSAPAVGAVTIDELELSGTALAGSSPSSSIYDIFAAGTAGKCKPQPKPRADLGDAPDSTNHAGVAMTAYPAVPARFPTVFDPTTGTPPGPKHLRPTALAWLGTSVSLENEADLLPDADGLPNIAPTGNAADQDGYDDGVILPIAIPWSCGQTQFDYVVTVPSTVPATQFPLTLYVNVWLDFNRDGDWDDPLQKCPLGLAATGSFTEWAVQNAAVTVPGPGTHTFTTPPFGAANPSGGREMWMRITLTDQPITPVQGQDGSGPVGGHAYGETEDYLLRLSYTELCGVKWNDLNADGQQDPGEPGLAGWVIEAKDPNGNLMGYVLTDDQGNYCLIVPAPGMYTVSEQPQSGWVQTMPPAPGAYTVTVPPARTDLAFGNQERREGKAEVCVFKFEDINGNGVRDPNEPLLGGWSFHVTPSPLPPAVSPLTTRPDGRVCFALAAPGTYTITEVVLPGWAPTTPNPQTVAVQPGQLVTLDFGNRRREPASRCDLVLRKVVDPAQGTAGQLVTYTLTVANVGGAPCPGPTTVTESVPAGLTLVSVSGPGWLCLGPVCTYLSPIPAGGSVSLTYTFQVSAPAGTVLENCATLSNPNDTHPDNNRACAAVHVVGRAQGPALPGGTVDLSLAKRMEGGLRAEQEAVYLLQVTHVGTATATGPIQVVDTLPHGLSFVAASGAGWTCMAIGQTVTCTHPGPLPPGGTLSLALRVRVRATPGAMLTNCATLSTPGDVNPGNNRACTTDPVER